VIYSNIVSRNLVNIQKAFGHKLIGSRFMKKEVASAVKLLPEKLAIFITEHCWFVSSFTDGWAFALRQDELKKGEYLIFLSDELLNQSGQQVRYTILHEIGHVILGHRNSIGKVQSKAEVRKQEKEADEFAIKFLRN
jgi:Zn-dependent protease with chaperone function